VINTFAGDPRNDNKGDKEIRTIYSFFFFFFFFEPIVVFSPA